MTIPTGPSAVSITFGAVLADHRNTIIEEPARRAAEPPSGPARGSPGQAHSPPEWRRRDAMG
jgi:hypothetical protein